MAGSGTGVPLWFVCPIERRNLNGGVRSYRAMVESGYEVVERARHTVTRTGRTKPWRPNGKLHHRMLTEHHEYECTCGHRGWTRQRDILRFPLPAPKPLIEVLAEPIEER